MPLKIHKISRRQQARANPLITDDLIGDVKAIADLCNPRILQPVGLIRHLGKHRRRWIDREIHAVFAAGDPQVRYARQHHLVVDIERTRVWDIRDRRVVVFQPKMLQFARFRVQYRRHLLVVGLILGPLSHPKQQ